MIKEINHLHTNAINSKLQLVVVHIYCGKCREGVERNEKLMQMSTLAVEDVFQRILLPAISLCCKALLCF